MDDLELAGLTIKKATKLGAQESDVFLVTTSKHSVEFADKGITSYRFSSEKIIGIRVIIDKRIGITSTNVESIRDVEKAVKEAIAIARASEPDARWVSLPSSLEPTPIEGAHDKRIQGLQPRDITDYVSTMIDAVHEESSGRAKVSTSKLEMGVARYTIANSYDSPISRLSSHILVNLEAVIEEADKRSTGSVVITKKRLDEVKFEEAGHEAASKAIKFVDAKPVETGVYNIVLTEKVFAEAIETMISGPISAEWVIEGRSPLADKLGKSIASNKLTIIDDPLMPWGYGSREFDDEGIPTRRIEVIKEGVLRSFIYDTYTARIHGRESTGNAHRTPSSRPRPRPNNLVCEPGDASLEEMIEEPRILVVYDTVGLWLSNPVSGQFNATVTHGILYDKGKEVERVKGVVLSADFWKMLRENLLLVGKNVDNLANYYAPAILVSNVYVSGK